MLLIMMMMMIMMNKNNDDDDQMDGDMNGDDKTDNKDNGEDEVDGDDSAQIGKKNYTQTTNQIHYPSSINIYCILSAGFIDGVATQVSARRTSPESDVSSLASQ